MTRKSSISTRRSGRPGPGLAAVVTLAALCAFAAPGTAQESPALDGAAAAATLREANTLYAAERFDEAASLYESIIRGGYGTADVYYNLGNARYKLGEDGQAVLAYERALRIEPGHDDARANLAFVREQLPDRQAPLEDGPLTAFFRRLLGAVHISALEATASALLFCFFGVLSLGVLRRRIAGWPFRVAVALLALFVFVTVTVGVRIHSLRNANDAVVMAREIAARTGPGDEFVLEFQLHEGTTVAVREARGEWTRITLRGTDLVGWVRSDGLEAI